MNTKWEWRMIQRAAAFSTLIATKLTTMLELSGMRWGLFREHCIFYFFCFTFKASSWVQILSVKCVQQHILSFFRTMSECFHTSNPWKHFPTIFYVLWKWSRSSECIRTLLLQYLLLSKFDQWWKCMFTPCINRLEIKCLLNETCCHLTTGQ